MKINTLSPWLLASLGAVSILVTAGCTINVGVPNQNSMPDNHAGHMMNGNSGDLTDSDFGPMDIMFAQMMIPHHQQAVDISQLALERAESEQVRELALQIMNEQDPEIQQMQGWIDQAGASNDMGHQMDMGGMLTEAEVQALAEASGEEFDRLFLAGMIAHHEGAIDMAQMIVNSQNEEARALAQAIISSQTEQISYMLTLLENY